MLWLWPHYKDSDKSSEREDKEGCLLFSATGQNLLLHPWRRSRELPPETESQSDVTAPHSRRYKGIITTYKGSGQRCL